LKSGHHTWIISKSLSNLNRTDWEKITANRNIYLSIPYLESIVITTTKDVEFFYVIAYNENKEPIVAGVFQLMPFIYKKSTLSLNFCKHLVQEKNSDHNFTMNILCCGNMFSTGENGFLWRTEACTHAEACDLMIEASERIKNDSDIKKKLSLVLFKEFWPQSIEPIDIFKNYNFKSFNLDVNMILRIHPSWKNINDYLYSMKTKFRTKAKSVFKKSNELNIKSLSFDEIQTYQDRINELFNNVLNRSKYSYGITYPSTFVAIKKALGDAFSFRAVFKDDLLIGFSTGFVQNKTFEANYVGLDYTYNFNFAVYQRLLYDYVDQAIACDAKELQLGRTSELIKSALGAIPIDMKLYAKHKAPLIHLLMSSILHFVSPSTFELRKPFKAKFNSVSTH
jgi:hypothetical protein